MSTMTSEIDILQRTIHIASSLAQHLNQNHNLTSFKQHLPPPNFESTLPFFILPFPHDTLAPVFRLQISENIRQEIIESFRTRIGELQNRYAASYRRACLESFQHSGFDQNFETIRDVYQALYRRQCLPMLESQVSFVLSEAAKLQETIIQDIKRPFNTEYTHVLETYFELNAYPSVHHRSILAQKSSMTTRQIEVWFQNHRKRAREDGKVTRRLDSDLPLKRALNVAPKPVKPSQTQLLTPPDDSISIITDNMGAGPHVFSPEGRTLFSVLDETAMSDELRPPHAFPATKKSHYNDPFPNENGVYRFPPPVWRRKPATIPIIPTEVDMDDFARTFQMKLNFTNGPWKRESTPSRSDIPPFTPWFAPSRTIPPSAPLPALVQNPASPPKPLPITPPSNRVIFHFNAKSKTSPLFSIVKLPYGVVPSVSTDLLAPASETPRRNISPLPRRTLNGLASSMSPTNLLTPPGEALRRKVSPLPRRAPSNAQSFGSRTSSFSSDISYTSSSSDDSSPSPSTPPPLPDQPLLSEFEIISQSGEPTSGLDDFSQFFDFSPQTFDFTFSKSSNDQASSLFNSPDPFFQGYTPLIPTS